jgi:hypothetical protein
MKEFFMAVAIKKGGEAHWAHTPWGQIIWNTGHRDHPGGIASQDDFSWKVTDGDSTKPGKSMKPGVLGTKPCDLEGFPGHWVLKFKTLLGAPSTFSSLSGAVVPLLEDKAINLGDFVEVRGEVVGNTGQSPGVYLGQRAVCLRGYGPRITTRAFDVAAAGFGQAALPVGASTAPVAPVGGAMAPPAPPGAAPTPPIVVTPHVGITAPPPPPGAAVAPPAPPAPPAALAGPTMTAAANGASYQSFIDAGWTPEQIKANGYCL